MEEKNTEEDNFNIEEKWVTISDMAWRLYCGNYTIEIYYNKVMNNFAYYIIRDEKEEVMYDNAGTLEEAQEASVIKLKRIIRDERNNSVYDPEIDLGKKYKELIDKHVEKDEVEDILEEARKLVKGNRHASYGSAADNFTDIGKIWGVLLGIDDISPDKVALCMAGLKLAREKFKHKRDNLVDLAGYSMLANDIAENLQKRK